MRRGRRSLLLLAPIGIFGGLAVRVVGDWSGSPHPPAEVTFVSDRSGSRSLWETTPAGTPVRPVLAVRGQQMLSPSWNPEGELAFVAVENGSFTVDVRRGRGDPRVAAHADGPISGVTWSGDGKELAFDRTLPGDPVRQQVVVLDVARQAERVLLERTGRVFGGLAWRPGSDTIALAIQSGAQQTHLLFVDARDGSTQEWSGTLDASPAWSSDGARLAFVRQTSDGWALVVSRPDGSQPRPLFTSSRVIFRPAWLRDNASLVFEHYDAGTEPDLWQVSGDGRAAALVTGPGFDGDAAVRRAGPRGRAGGLARPAGDRGPGRTS